MVQVIKCVQWYKFLGLDMYKYVKELGNEQKQYLDLMNIKERDLMAKLRSGANELRIDRGRDLKLLRIERYFQLCRGETYIFKN